VRGRGGQSPSCMRDVLTASQRHVSGRTDDELHQAEAAPKGNQPAELIKWEQKRREKGKKGHRISSSSSPRLVTGIEDALAVSGLRMQSLL